LIWAAQVLWSFLRTKFVSKESDVVRFIRQAQVNNPRYLERKYFNRWVKKTLGMGLYAGAVKRDHKAPIEEKFWASPRAALKDMFCSCCSETTTPIPEARV